jgi:uncharacterized protein (TIGR02271 family)
VLANVDPRQLIGRTVVGPNGEKIGQVGTVYLGDRTGTPAFATVRTGLFGTRQSFVPLDQADLAGDDIAVPYDKNMVKGAPNVDADKHLSPDEEAQLYDYYSLSYADGDERPQDAGYSGDAPAPADAGRSDRRDDDAMTRSEQRLNVGTERVERGQARLRKYVTTEQVQQTVPVTREEVRVEREPITDDNVDQATRGPEITEAEHEVTLTEERPVVAKETVPVERVRLSKDTVADEAQVADEVAKERIEADGVDDARGTRSGRGRHRGR